jgi:glycosyltransferase involved in cell wall biosynthesis
MLKKILFIAPLPPLEGGIPLHSQYLARSLKKLHPTWVWAPLTSFPDFPYRGKSRFENDSKSETRLSGLAHGGLSKMRILLRIISLEPRSYGAVLIPWWRVRWSIPTAGIAIIMKAKGVPVALFCHDVYPKNARSWERAISRFTIRQFPNIFVQTEAELRLIRSFHPKSVCTILSHPAYPSPRPSVAGNSKQTESSDPLRVLFFGYIREYKGIETLLTAAAQVSSEKFHFHFVGEARDGNVAESIRTASQRQQNITYDLSYVSQSSLAKIFNSSDLLVLPYFKATGSGVLAMAKGMRVPVIISDSVDPGSAFVPGRDGQIFTSGDPTHLASSLEKFRTNRQDFEKSWADVKPDDEWSAMARKLIDNLVH